MVKLPPETVIGTPAPALPWWMMLFSKMPVLLPPSRIALSVKTPLTRVLNPMYRFVFGTGVPPGLLPTLIRLSELTPMLL